jgi:cyanophycinase
VVENDKRFTVIGSGAVYIIDGTRIAYSSLSEESQQGTMSIFGLSLHVLADKDQYDLAARKPVLPAGADGRRGES